MCACVEAAREIYTFDLEKQGPSNLITLSATVMNLPFLGRHREQELNSFGALEFKGALLRNEQELVGILRSFIEK